MRKMQANHYLFMMPLILMSLVNISSAAEDNFEDEPGACSEKARLLPHDVYSGNVVEKSSPKLGSVVPPSDVPDVTYFYTLLSLAVGPFPL